MIGVEEKRIGDHLYTVRQFTTTPGTKLATKLLNIVGPSLATIVGSAATGKGLETDIGASTWHLAVESLMAKADVDVVQDIIKQLVSQIDVDGKPLSGVYEVHFRGKLGDLVKVLGFAIEVQFGNFFEGFGDKLKTILAMTTSQQSPMNPMSTGSSGVQ